MLACIAGVSLVLHYGLNLGWGVSVLIGAILAPTDPVLAGILSERDYARKIVLRDRSSRDTRVEEIMTAKLVTVAGEGDKAATGAQAMAMGGACKGCHDKFRLDDKK